MDLIVRSRQLACTPMFVTLLFVSLLTLSLAPVCGKNALAATPQLPVDAQTVLDQPVDQTNFQNSPVQQPTIQQPVPMQRGAVTQPPRNTSQSTSDLARESIFHYLRSTWDNSTANREDASRRFVAEQSVMLSEPDVLLAYIVNRMKFHRYDEALQLARLLHESNPSNIDAGMLRIWLEAVNDEYERTLVGIQSLRDQLDDAAISPSVRKSVISRSGRLIGYLQGPVVENIEQVTLETVIENFVDGLSPEEIALFNGRREGILAKFELKKKESGDFLADEEQKIREENAMRSNLLINENNLLENRTSQIQPQIQQLRDRGSQLVAQERSRSVPLQSELGALSGQLNRIDRDLNFLAADLLHIQQYSPGHHSEHLIVNQIQNLRFNRRNLVASGNSISNELAAINNRALQIENDFGQMINGLDNELSGIRRDLRKNTKELSKIADGPKVAPGKKTSRRIELRDLKTYYPFPTELYRAELVKRFLN